MSTRNPFQPYLDRLSRTTTWDAANRLAFQELYSRLLANQAEVVFEDRLTELAEIIAGIDKIFPAIAQMYRSEVLNPQLSGQVQDRRADETLTELALFMGRLTTGHN